MRKRRFIAFWDILIISIIGVVLFSVAIYIEIFIRGKTPWYAFPWYYTLIFAFCVAIPVTSLFWLQRVTIDLNCDSVNIYYLVNYEKNDRDINTNWNIYPSQIEKVSVVKLTKEEKRKYTSARFLFSKYLKIEMKYGNIKYVYISHYSNSQIKKIIKLLTSKNK